MPEARPLIGEWLIGGGGALALEAIMDRALRATVEACAQHLEHHAEKLDREGLLHEADARATRWAAGLLRSFPRH